MRNDAHVWPLILAAGEGRRLQTLTRNSAGAHVPKQFCSLLGGPSLLHDALSRAGSIGPRENICTIVAVEHWRWWDGVLGTLPSSNVIVQPRNRGTAIGILLPLLHILASDCEAQVVVLPSDHYVRDEATLRRSLQEAVARVATHPDDVLLLGIEAEEPDPELGYIVPGNELDAGAFEIDAFVEKPPVTRAVALIDRGGLWNAFVVVTDARALLRLFERRFPEIVREMRRVVQGMVNYPHLTASLAELYSRLPVVDFSRDILEVGLLGCLRVFPVPACGWTDLGTPRRIAETVRRLSDGEVRSAMSSGEVAQVNLAERSDDLLRADQVPGLLGPIFKRALPVRSIEGPAGQGGSTSPS
jgi:mannose-1-phosphate guanylyltransferase